MKLRWSAEARQQLAEARLYIENDNPTAALAVVHAIRAAAERLARFPEAGRQDPFTASRVCTVPRTPYRLHYVVAGDVIRILSVWHGARQWPPARD
ncbi:type II toxin-antitoxin system RelE/ParE family toxin [Falsiroseomonas oryzae]|uniref:type II toxin-antitoxin system RelE/ParE family toxin n=1 Tax=Falsiroseomonas oryzae TaxID=2766473 RepID=UPI0022EA9A27|nr:type II toxin-antitoxin system RelE/ParE family toxin [Roseomonas sp. MO-31]